MAKKIYFYNLIFSFKKSEKIQDKNQLSKNNLYLENIILRKNIVSDLQKIVPQGSEDNKEFFFSKKLFNPFISELKGKANFIKAAGGLVLNEKKFPLLIFRKNKWDIPKGKIEKNENFMDAAKREVKEETGINDISVTDFFCSTYHIYFLKSELVLKKTKWYFMSSKSSEKLIPQEGELITKVKWVKPQKVKKVLKNIHPMMGDLLLKAENLNKLWQK